jgi:hypothetical protein
MRIVLFEAGTRRMETRKSGEQAMADIREARLRADGILPSGPKAHKPGRFRVA